MKAHLRRIVAGVVMTLAVMPLAFATPLAFSHFGPVAALAAIHQADSITEGHGRKPLYVFMDPNCPYCHKLFERLQPQIGPNNLTVHWIVVGILRRTSPGKAVAILGAPDPLRALKTNEYHFHLATGGGAIRPVPVAGRAGQELRMNEHLFNEAGADGVPVLLYRNVQGKVVMLQGLSPSAAALQHVLAAVRPVAHF